MSLSTKFVAIADLPPPPSEPTEYKVSWFLLTAICVGLAQMGAFFGIFFSSFGSDSGLAWWSFCFVGTGIAGFFNHLNNSTATVVRNGKTFEMKNYWGKVRFTAVPLDKYEGVESLNSKHTRFALVRTDEHVAYLKKEFSCCACCIGKKIRFCFGKDGERFARDHGLLASGQGAENV